MASTIEPLEECITEDSYKHHHHQNMNESSRSKTSIRDCIENFRIIWSKIINCDRWSRFIRGGGTETTRVYHFWPGKNVKKKFCLPKKKIPF